MRCSQAFCTDCITKLDGINHCRGCLAKMGREVAQAQEGETGSRVPPALAIATGRALLSLLAWGMLEVLLPGRFTP